MTYETAAEAMTDYLEGLITLQELQAIINNQEK
jgi:hypothetical protein